MSIAEAVHQLSCFHDVPGYDRLLSMDGVIDPDHGAWTFLKSGLSAGAVDSFIQPHGGETYLKIPAAYWKTFRHDAQRQDIFAGMPSAVGHSDALIGRPVVIWADGLDLLHEVFAKLACMARDSANAGSSTQLPALEYTESLAGPFSSSSSWSDISDWYQTYVADAPAEGYTREEDERAGRSIGIGRERMRALRREYAPSGWSKDGPKRRGN